MVRGTIEYHRARIRAHLGFREATVQDGHALVAWLVEIARLERLRAVGLPPDLFRDASHWQPSYVAGILKERSYVGEGYAGQWKPVEDPKSGRKKLVKTEASAWRLFGPDIQAIGREIARPQAEMHQAQASLLEVRHDAREPC